MPVVAVPEFVDDVPGFEAVPESLDDVPVELAVHEDPVPELSLVVPPDEVPVVEVSPVFVDVESAVPLDVVDVPDVVPAVPSDVPVEAGP
jgi:hypothetical protein